MILDTRSGPVEGIRVGDVIAFLGLAYAAPPVGANRWRAPQALDNWTKPILADSFGPGAIQTRRTDSEFDVELQSENCLTLNIWIPPHSPGAALPVMVWIHGGGFEWGGSALPVYHGDRLAAQGVVVVSVNYRLGPFGTFSHPDQISPANFATLDLVAALEWINANILAFGGDPSRVTIAGQSAGASHVICLMATQAARGLFHAAVALSPTGLQGFRSTLGSFANIGTIMAGQLECANTIIDLRKTAADEIISVADAVKASAGFFLWQPVIDGDIFLRPPADTFAASEQAMVPLMIGDTDWEGSDFQNFDSNAQASCLLQIGADKFAQLHSDYQSAPNCIGTGDFAAKLLFSASVQFLAQCHKRAGAPVWRYRLTHRLAELDRLRGCGHGDDLPLLMGHFGVNGYANPSAADLAMSASLQARAISMAVNGNPGSGWDQYSADDDHVLGMQNGREAPISLANENLRRLADQLRAATAAGRADRLHMPEA